MRKVAKGLSIAKRGEAAEFANNALNYDGDECLTWPFSVGPNGYAMFGVKRKRLTVSRWICEQINGKPPTPEHQAAHSCGNGTRGCIAKNHLSWKTRKENERDKLTHGTHNRGERSGLAKLKEDQVREIKRLQGVVSQKELGLMFGVKRSTIASVHQGVSWRYSQ